MMKPEEHFAEQWLRRHLGAVCANLSRNPVPSGWKGPRAAPGGAEHVYPRLLNCGRELPLNLVLDLSCIFSEGPDIEFRPSARDGPWIPRKRNGIASFSGALPRKVLSETWLSRPEGPLAKGVWKRNPSGIPGRGRYNAYEWQPAARRERGKPSGCSHFSI